jgi:hypothetical protein
MDVAGFKSRSNEVINRNDGAAGFRRFSSASRASNSLSMAVGSDQFLTECGERVTIARSDGVGGQSELRCDLSEGKLPPNLEDEDFPLLSRQTQKSGLDCASTLVAFGRRREERGFILIVTFGLELAPGAPCVSPRKVHCGSANGGNHQCERLTAEISLMAPESNESFLQNILSVRERTRTLSRNQQ